MPIVNTESLFSTIVPSVTVKKITLETGGTKIKEENPHIAHPREAQKQGKYSKSQRQEITDTPGNLRVTLDLVVKQTFGEDALSKWFKEEDFIKYFKLRLVQSEDSALTERIKRNPLKTLMNTNRFRRISRLDGITAQHLSLKTDARLSDDPKLEGTFKTTDPDGKEIHDILYRTEFIIGEEQPEHLAYFAITYLDVDQLAKDFDLDLDTNRVARKANGKVTAELVIEDSDIISETSIFYTPEGELWAGPVHKMENGLWMSYGEHTENSVYLTRTIVPNAKVQDFRNVRDIEKLQQDFSLIEKDILSGLKFKNKRGVVLSLDTDDNCPYFSDMMISKDNGGDLRFFFSFDIVNFARNKTQFGHLFKKRQISRLLQNIRIRSFKILRHRVKNTYESTSVGSPKCASEPFDKNEPPDIVALTSETAPGRFNPIHTETVALRELRNLATPGNRNMGFRHFTGIDFFLSEITDGFYQYCIEVEIEDRTHLYLKDSAGQLYTAANILERYLKQATLPGNFDPISNRFTQEFQNKMKRKAARSGERGTPWNRAIAAYVENLIRFSSLDRRKAGRIVDFLKAVVSPESGTPQGVMKLQQLIETLASQLLALGGMSGRPTKSRGRSSTTALSRASITKSPTIRVVSLSKTFNHIIDSNDPKDTGYEYLLRDARPAWPKRPRPLRRNRRMSRRERKKMRYRFMKQIKQHRAEASKTRRAIAEHKDRNATGLVIIKGDDYKKRSELEVLKHFTDLNTSIDLESADTAITEGPENSLNIRNNSFNFLSPSFINVFGMEDFSMLHRAAGSDDSSAYRSLENYILKFNTDRRAGVPSQGIEDLIGGGILELFESLGCSVETFESPLPSDKMRIAKKEVDPSEYFGDGDSFASGSLEIDDLSKLKMKRALKLGMKMKGHAIERRMTKKEKAKLRAAKSLNRLATPVFANASFNSRASQRRATPMRHKKRRTRKSQAFYNNIKTLPKNKGHGIPPQWLALYGAGNPNLNSVGGRVSKQIEEYNTSVDNNEDTDATFNFQYRMIKRIEVFVGYQMDTPGIKSPSRSVSIPIFEPLSVDMFNSPEARNRYLLCRMADHNEDASGFSKPGGLDLPSYHEYFLLNPTNAADESVNLAEYTENPLAALVNTRISAAERGLSNQAFLEMAQTLLVQGEDFDIKNAQREASRIFAGEELEAKMKKYLGSMSSYLDDSKKIMANLPPPPAPRPPAEMVKKLETEGKYKAFSSFYNAIREAADAKREVKKLVKAAKKLYKRVHRMAYDDDVRITDSTKQALDIMDDVVEALTKDFETASLHVEKLQAISLKVSRATHAAKQAKDRAQRAREARARAERRKLEAQRRADERRARKKRRAERRKLAKARATAALAAEEARRAAKRRAERKKAKGPSSPPPARGSRKTKASPLQQRLKRQREAAAKAAAEQRRRAKEAREARRRKAAAAAAARKRAAEKKRKATVAGRRKKSSGRKRVRSKAKIGGKARRGKKGSGMGRKGGKY